MSSGTYVGLMSGTSLDGISAAVARFASAQGDAFNVELLGFHVHEYSAEQRARLLAAMRDGSARDYCRLAVDFSSASDAVILAAMANQQGCIRARPFAGCRGSATARPR